MRMYPGHKQACHDSTYQDINASGPFEVVLVCKLLQLPGKRDEEVYTIIGSRSLHRACPDQPIRIPTAQAPGMPTRHGVAATWRAT